MRVGKAMGALLGAAILGGCTVAPAALAAPTPVPAWSIQSLAAPTNFEPGAGGDGPNSYQVHITNSGGEVTDQSPITIVDTLPKGLAVESVKLFPPRNSLNDIGKACKTETV